MQKRQLGIVLSLVVVVVVALVAWWSWPEPLTTPVERELGAHAAGAVAVAGAMGGEGEARTEVPHLARDAAVAVAEAALAGTPADVAIEVEVVDQRTEAGVAGAQLLFWDAAAEAAYQQLPDDHPHRPYDSAEQQLRNCGRIVCTDERGRARIAVQPGSTIVAEAEGAFGSVVIDDLERTRGEIVRIAILPDRNVRVRVKTASGEPVPQGIVTLLATGDDGRPDWERELRRELTGDDGEAVFRHLQWPRDEEPAIVGPLVCWFVPLLPGCFDTCAAVRGDALPTAPIELTLPPCGSIVATLPDDAGADGQRFSLRLANGTSRQTRDEVVRDGRLVFAHVGLGERFVIRSWSMGLDTEFDGPERAGEVVTVALRDAADAALLVGKLRDVDGQPIANGLLSLSFTCLRNSHSVECRTDAHGAFAFRSSVFRDGRVVEAANLVVGTRYRHRPEAVAIGSVKLRAGRNDLGELRLARPPLLCAGRLSVLGAEPSASWEPIVDSAAADSTWWRRVEGLQAHRDGGRFEVRGVPPAGQRLRLHFGERVYLVGGPVEFAPGAVDLELVAATAVGFAAAVRCDDGIEPKLAVELVPVRVAAGLLLGFDPARGQGLELHPSGARGDRQMFERSVPPGVYRLHCRSQGFAALPAVDEFELVAGNGPRVEEVDLRGKLANLVLKVVDQHGESHTARIASLGSTDLTFSSCRQFDPGEVLVVPKGPHDLLVFGFKFAPVEVRGVEGHVEVRVQSWRAVEFPVSGLVPLPAGWSYWLRARPMDEPRREWNRRADFERCPGGEACLQDGKVRLCLGDQTMRLSLVVRVDGDGRSVEIVDLQPPTGTARDGMLPVVVNAATLTAAIASLQGQAATPR